MDEDIIFLGSLLIKIIAVANVNAYGFAGLIACTNQLQDPQPFDNENALKRSFMTSICSLFNHSCFPTAEWRYTKRNTLAVVALQPIKVNSQIFVDYKNHPFYLHDRSTRHANLYKYNFVCNCPACAKAWPPIIVSMEPTQPEGRFDFVVGRNGAIMMEIYEDLKGNIDEKFLKKLTTLITQTSNLKQPSLTYCSLIYIFQKILYNIYCPEPPFIDPCY